MDKRLILVLLVALSAVAGCVVVESCDSQDVVEPGTQVSTPSSSAAPDSISSYVQPNDTYELFKTDVLDLIDKKQITSAQVTVDGVQLGDNFQEAIDKVGYPQYIDEFLDGVVLNAKYENEDGTTKYLLHFENNVLTRIVIRETTPGLIGTSVPDMDQAEITSRFGKPDASEDNAGNTVSFRTYYYYDLGLEVYHKRKHMIGYAFVMPQ